MEVITARLQQLEEIESTMHAERISVIADRKKEDNETQNTRLREDDAWNKRMEARDREEDVSKSLVIRIHLTGQTRRYFYASENCPGFRCYGLQLSNLLYLSMHQKS